MNVIAINTKSKKTIPTMLFEMDDMLTYAQRNNLLCVTEEFVTEVNDIFKQDESLFTSSSDEIVSCVILINLFRQETKTVLTHFKNARATEVLYSYYIRDKIAMH